MELKLSLVNPELVESAKTKGWKSLPLLTKCDETAAFGLESRWTCV